MKTALKFSLKNKFLKKGDYDFILDHIYKCGLQSDLNKFFKVKDLNKILSFMLKDKKNKTNKINLILLKKIGTPLINQEFKKQTIALFLKKELSD